MLHGEVASSLSVRRLKWRLANLSAGEFLRSLFPRTIRLEKLDLEGFERLYAGRVRLEGAAGEARPFLIVKPEGLTFEDRIRRALVDLCVRVESAHQIDDHVRLQLSLLGLREPETTAPSRATAAKAHEDHRRHLLTLFLRIEADRTRLPGTYDRSKVLLLDGVDLDDLRRLKRHVRSRVGPIRFVRVVWKRMSETVYSSYVHVPDRADLAREYAIVKRFL